jgi:hypothetical protein
MVPNDTFASTSGILTNGRAVDQRVRRGPLGTSRRARRRSSSRDGRHTGIPAPPRLSPAASCRATDFISDPPVRQTTATGAIPTRTDPGRLGPVVERHRGAAASSGCDVRDSTCATATNTRGRRWPRTAATSCSQLGGHGLGRWRIPAAAHARPSCGRRLTSRSSSTRSRGRAGLSRGPGTPPKSAHRAQVVKQLSPSARTASRCTADEDALPRLRSLSPTGLRADRSRRAGNNNAGPDANGYSRRHARRRSPCTASSIPAIARSTRTTEPAWTIAAPGGDRGGLKRAHLRAVSKLRARRRSGASRDREPAAARATRRPMVIPGGPVSLMLAVPRRILHSPRRCALILTTKYKPLPPPTSRCTQSTVRQGHRRRASGTLVDRPRRRRCRRQPRCPSASTSTPASATIS